MEETDDMDSLFEGMDFVNPLCFSDAEAFSSPHSLSAPLDLHDFTDQAARAEMIAAPNAETTLKILEKPDQKANAHNASIDSILAAFDSETSKVQPFLSKQNVDALKPGVRRKRRSIKIGYGRDDADDARSFSETASNGSAIEEQSIGLPELIVVAHNGISTGGHEAVTSPIRNGHHREISMTSDDIDATQENNLAMLTEQLDIGDVNMDSSEVQTSDPGMVLSNLHNVLESLPVPTSDSKASETRESSLKLADEVLHSAEAETVEATKKCVEVSSIPAQSLHSTAAPSVADIDHDIEIASALSIKSNIASTTVSQESELDVLELKVKVSPGLSMEERLCFIQKAVAANAECIQQRIAAISQARKVAAQKRRQMAEVVSRTSAKFKQVEEDIQVACEREDFETAEKLDKALALAETAREAAMEEFGAVEAEYDKCASKMQEVIEMQITSEEESFLLLKQLGQDAADAADQLKKESDDECTTKMDAIANDEVAVKLEKEKLMQEVQIVEEAKSELRNAIKSSTQTELEEKQTLVEERQVLLQELDALLAAVKLKETQISEQDKKIGDLEAKINSRVAGFDKETVELEANLQNLASKLDGLQKKSEGLDVQKIQVDAEVLQAHEAAEKLHELSSVAKLEAQKLQDALHVRKAAAEAMCSSKEKKLSLAAQEKQHVEDAHGLRNQSASLRTSLQELASDKMKLHQELISANQQISSIETRVPELESEKKLAAASRNFKEAGRLAAEAKALLSSKEKLASDVKRVMEDLQRLEQEMESHMSDLSELEGQLQLKEKQAAMARCGRLKLLAAALRDERDAAAELQDFEEAKSLDVEAEAADKEADELQKSFGFVGDAC